MGPEQKKCPYEARPAGKCVRIGEDSKISPQLHEYDDAVTIAMREKSI
jgi:hypothetical protein